MGRPKDLTFVKLGVVLFNGDLHYWILSDIEQFQDAQCDDIPSGSLSKSSKKRRGRPPAVLMEPREEADRPVLTPNGRE